ncbi:GNAT family N-acetyltransferase [Paenibacillus sp. SAFN-117]|uniref:GNAT family N-acetyltransferase n=1 Tax=Paenibacillus sp. SAFN-117 TaxID=3436860 RepID=UPI003F80CA64
MKLPVINEEWARRIQQSEVEFFTSRISSIGEREGNPNGVEIRRFGKSTAFYVREMPWSLFNSVKGFSHEDLGRLEEIVQFYRERQRAFQMDINPVGCSPELFKELARHGLQQEGFHSVLYGLPKAELPTLPAEISIREVKDEEDFQHYAEVHCVGSGMAPVHKHHFFNNNIGLLGRPGWRIYLASWQEQPAAVAVMHISDDIASCTLAATAPQFRRKGLHTALLLRRMHDAYKADCRLVAAQASFAGTSQNNMERAGMRIAWTRAVWGTVTT